MPLAPSRAADRGRRRLALALLAEGHRDVLNVPIAVPARRRVRRRLRRGAARAHRRRERRPVRGLRAAGDPRGDRADRRRSSKPIAAAHATYSRSLSRHQGGHAPDDRSVLHTRSDPIKDRKGKALAYRWYDPDKMVLGKRMEDQLRFAVCYWHSFCWPGGDPFGGETFLRPWMHAADEMEGARLKADVAFEMFDLLGVPFFSFHDRDIAPEGATLAEIEPQRPRDRRASSPRRCRRRSVKLLWGTANLFSNRRYMAGAATNPDPEVFAYAAAQVKNALDADARAGRRELRALGRARGLRDAAQHRHEARARPARPLPHLVVEHKHKIGFKGTFLIEPKPKEPTKHQYDFDVATIFGFLKQLRARERGQDQHRAEPRHPRRPHLRARDGAGDGARHLRLDRHQPRRLPARLGHRPVRHEHPARWRSPAITSSRPAASPPAASTSTPRCAASRSIRTTCSRRTSARWTPAPAALLIAEKMIKDGALDGFVDDRYAGWDGKEGKAILAGRTLARRPLRITCSRRGSTRSRRAASRSTSSGC